MSGGSPKVDTNELTRKMKGVAKDLTELHRDLYWLALQSLDSADTQLLSELQVDVVTEFKFAVDSMRDLLWKYLDAAAKAQPELVKEATDSQRLRRMTQLLQLLRERLGQRSDQQPVSFIERISVAVNKRLGDSKVA